MFAIKGVHTIKSRNRKTRRGGTIKQLSDYVNLMKQLHTNLPESEAVLEAFRIKMLVIVAYEHPSYDFKKFVNELDKD